MLTTDWQQNDLGLRSESGETTAAASRDRLSLNRPHAFMGRLLHACPKLGAAVGAQLCLPLPGQSFVFLLWLSPLCGVWLGMVGGGGLRGGGSLTV